MSNIYKNKMFNKKTILILGGSQGSTALNQLIKKYINRAEIQGDNPQVRSKQKQVEVMGGSGVMDAAPVYW